jgi:hypothetical protein
MVRFNLLEKRVVRTLRRCVWIGVCALQTLAPALACPLPYVGSLDPLNPNDVTLLCFTLLVSGDVDIQSWGYGGTADAAGGTHAAGARIAACGFDSRLTLFKALGDGAVFRSSNDGCDCPVGHAAPACHDASSAALAASGIEADYVEEAIPSRTFSGSLILNASAGVASTVGPVSGVLGVTSITITNHYSVSMLLDVTPNPACAPLPGLGGNPQVSVWVPPRSTLHLTDPTPLVFNPTQGAHCLAVVGNEGNNVGSITFSINGVVNWS